MIIVDITRQRQFSSVHSLISADRRSSCSASEETLIYTLTDSQLRPVLVQTSCCCERAHWRRACLRACVRELTVQQRKLLEVEADVVLLGEDVDGAAGLREQVQVELQRHDGPVSARHHRV